MEKVPGLSSPTGITWEEHISLQRLRTVYHVNTQARGRGSSSAPAGGAQPRTPTQALWVLEGTLWALWAAAGLGHSGGSRSFIVEAPLCAGNLPGAATRTVVDENGVL